MVDNFSAILLAAGESRRMGQPKPLLPWGSRTVLEQVLDILGHSPVDEIVVVLGSRAEEVGEVVRRARLNVPVRTVVNAHYQEGMLSSVKAGIAALAPDVRAAFVVLCDQPHLQISTLERLRSAFRSADKGLVVPSYREQRGHPLLIDVVRYRAEILALAGAPGLQKILHDHPDDILHVEFDNPGVVTDIDTPERYARLKPLP